MKRRTPPLVLEFFYFLFYNNRNHKLIDKIKKWSWGLELDAETKYLVSDAPVDVYEFLKRRTLKYNP